MVKNKIIMKHIKILILFLLLGCKQLTSNGTDFNSLGLGDLMNAGYELRNDSVFHKICSLLNDSVLSKNNSFYMIPIFVTEIIDISHGTHDTVVGEPYFDQKTIGEFMGSEAPPLYVNLRNDSLFINKVYYENDSSYFIKENYYNKEEFKEIASHFIYHEYKKYGVFGKIEYNTKYFGKQDISTAFIKLCIKIRDELSINDWVFFFNTLHEIFSIFEEKQNQLALKTWGIDFNSLSNEQKIGIYEMFPYRVVLFFDRN